MSGIPPDMAYVRIDRPGPPEVLVPARMPVPAPRTGEVLIKVAAAGINRPDVLQRQGGYPPPPGASDVPGLEVAGEIVAFGESVDRWRVGDRVMALVSSGGYAEYCVAPAPQVLPIPAGLSMTEAGAVPETFFTVWTNVFERGRLQAGESLLVDGGSSGSAPLPSSSRMHSEPRSTPPWAAPTNSAPVWNWAPSARSTTATRTSSRPCARRPAAAAST